MIERPRTAEAQAPLISVIAPCYNAERYLEQALESIYAQDYPNFEVIIVDDGSSDRSLEMLRQLQPRYGFALYTQANQGVSGALNTGLKHARGVYVATPDLDDVMLPHSLSVRARYLDQHPDVGLVGALIHYMDEHGTLRKQQRPRGIRQLDFASILANGEVVGAPVSLYRMEALRAVEGYDPDIRVQDFQITLRIARRGYGVHIIPEVVTHYRRHPNNLSRRYKVLLESDLRTIEPYKGHPAYARGRVTLINKALKYAVIQDKRDAWRLLREIPWRLIDGTTLRRVKRLLFHY
ncbi:glycosyltransferase family 2 protein [Pseudomonas sp. DC3000-4b1]|uniref:glycosyltransferase family 2 protein n=1 Tax=unclassified Pseudomonas TaxID=196821 RepID=UPI003CECE803